MIAQSLPVIVIDFETTGISPEHGARATEVAAVLISDGRIVGRYQSLMNADVPIPPFIEALTGITNRMVREAPSAAKVMRELADFIGEKPLVAHNAAFDKKFLQAELRLVGQVHQSEIHCSMRLARRIYPDAPNHKLATLVRYKQVARTGAYHRALADAEMTAGLWLKMQEDLGRQFGLDSIPLELLRKIQNAPSRELQRCVDSYRRSCKSSSKQS